MKVRIFLCSWKINKDHGAPGRLILHQLCLKTSHLTQVYYTDTNFGDFLMHGAFDGY